MKEIYFEMNPFFRIMLKYKKITLLDMKKYQLIIGIVSLLMSVYYFVKRHDIIQELFKLGLNAVSIGKLILPSILLIFGITLLAFKKEKNV